MIRADLLELVRCPGTGQPLVVAAPEVLAAANARQMAGGGAAVEAALVRADGTALYPVCDGIPVLLMERAIPL